MSDTDIAAGQRWADEVQSELQRANFGIVVVTPENRLSSWLNFESGAIAKVMATSRVVPYLVAMRPSDLGYPLAMFQAVEANEAGTLRLVFGVNAAVGDRMMSQSQVERVFVPQWPALQSALLAAPEPADPSASPPRSEREILEEILDRVREDRSGVRVDSVETGANPPQRVRQWTLRESDKFGLPTEVVLRSDRGSLRSFLTRIESQVGAGYEAALPIVPDPSAAEFKGATLVMHNGDRRCDVYRDMVSQLPALRLAIGG